MDFNSIFILLLETLLMTLISTFLAYLIGLPIGVVLNITSKNGLKPNKIINLILGTFVNILRSIPCLIIVVIFLPVVRTFFGRGSGAWYTMIIPLFIASFGFVARIVEQSLSEVPTGEIEAVKALGATNFQIIYKVLLPEARSSLLMGLAVSLVSILGYTSFAYNIGSGGLISGIWEYYTRNTGSYLESWYFWLLIIIVVVIVQVIQELGLILAKKIDKRRLLKWKKDLD